MMIWNKRGVVLLGLLLLILTTAVGAGVSLAFNGGQDSAKTIPDLQASPIEYPISIQGILSDGSGKPVADGAHEITLSIYDQATGGTRLWQESQSVVSSGGLFDALLGKGTPIDPSVLDESPETYLGVKIGNDSELNPRIRLAYAPYAIQAVSSKNSDTLDGFDSSDFALKGEVQASGSVTVTASSYSPFSSSIVDNEGNVGTYSDVAIGLDGFPVISYHDESGRDLKMAKCTSIDCSSVIINTLDTDGIVGKYSSIAIGDDGLPIISYFDDSNDSLKIAHCSNSVCSRTTITEIDTGGVGKFTSIAIGEDGMPVVSYFDNDKEDLLFVQCEDEECTDVNSSVVDNVGDVGSYSSVAIGIDELPIISYYDDTNDTLKVAHCTDDDCDSSTITTLDNAGDSGEYTSLVIGVDGFAVISYYDAGDRDLKVAHCSNIACTSSSISTIDSAGEVGLFTSISIGVDGFPLISYFDESGNNLKLAHCSDVSCTSADRILTVDWPGRVGEHSVNVPSIDGLPIIVYYDETSGALKAMRCAKVGCAIP